MVQPKGTSQQEEVSTLFKEIDSVGTSYPNPFVPREFPEFIVRQHTNFNIYESFKLKNTLENFEAGKTRHFKENWFKITHDKVIRDIICGYKLELEEMPFQNSVPKPLEFSAEDQEKMNNEIDRFLKCNIIEKVSGSTPGEYISNIFFRPKKDGKIRIILNLKNLNKTYLSKIHFKMETLHSAIASMRKDCFFGSVDLSDAFYSILIREQDRKYFRFVHNDQKFQFTALIMGLTHSPRIFTKILKPVFAKLRAKRHISSAYIDDSCLQGATFTVTGKGMRHAP